jgi:hypothetical protein
MLTFSTRSSLVRYNDLYDIPIALTDFGTITESVERFITEKATPRFWSNFREYDVRL